MLVSSSFILFFILHSFLLFFFSNAVPYSSHQSTVQPSRRPPKFYLDILEEELLAMLAVVFAPTSSTSANPTNSLSKKAPNIKHAASTAANLSNTMESESVVSHEDADADGWMEVGKQNRMVVTRTVRGPFYSIHPSIFLFFCPSLLVSYSLSTQINMAVRSRKYSPHINNGVQKYTLCVEIFVQCAENL